MKHANGRVAVEHRCSTCRNAAVGASPRPQKPRARAPSPRAVLHDLVLWQILGRSKFLAGAKVHVLSTNIGLS